MGDARPRPHSEAHRAAGSAATLADKWATDDGRGLPPMSPTVPTRAAAVAPDDLDAFTLPATATAAGNGGVTTAGHGGATTAGASFEPSFLYPSFAVAASSSQLPSPHRPFAFDGGTSQPPFPVPSFLATIAATGARFRTSNSSPQSHGSAGDAAAVAGADVLPFPSDLDGPVLPGASALPTIHGAPSIFVVDDVRPEVGGPTDSRTAAIEDAVWELVHGAAGVVPRPPSGATVSGSEDGVLTTPLPPLPGEEPARAAFTPLVGRDNTARRRQRWRHARALGGGVPTPLLGPARSTTPPPHFTATPTQLTSPSMGCHTPSLLPSIGAVGAPSWLGSGSGSLTLPPSPHTSWPALRTSRDPPPGRQAVGGGCRMGGRHHRQPVAVSRRDQRRGGNRVTHGYNTRH
eukprot:TRINITY_DN15769_c0_g1_i1.p2 TRINITY_DN15769_c0_g1~~TRINITY_DN15769_c0_g1_i1.p2  ORF type:complete len:404 (+),score=39.05 TRINITY_DN15769_c0_g1_i1:376-1587(+)